jgi:hypothetical protein
LQCGCNSKRKQIDDYISFYALILVFVFILVSKIVHIYFASFSFSLTKFILRQGRNGEKGRRQWMGGERGRERRGHPVMHGTEPVRPKASPVYK